MTIQDNFTPAEWTTLLQTPMTAGMAIISSDVGITSVPKETAAMMRAILENPIPEGAGELVGALVADMKAKAENKEQIAAPDIKGKDPQAIAAELSANLQNAALLADSKLSAESAQAYKEWVYSVAQSVAEAGKEGGFLGIGAERVSSQEKTALAALRSDLGLAPLA